jgi:hypothetical protein
MGYFARCIRTVAPIIGIHLNNGLVDKQNLTQFGRALKQLKIEHIAAYSPQARGRSERMFATLQGRLPKEFVLHGITTVEEANRYLQESICPAITNSFQ